MPMPTLWQDAVELVDESHRAAHRRLRHDLTEGLNDDRRAIESLQKENGRLLARIRQLEEVSGGLTFGEAILAGTLIAVGSRVLELLVSVLLG